MIKHISYIDISDEWVDFWNTSFCGYSHQARPQHLFLLLTMENLSGLVECWIMIYKHVAWELHFHFEFTEKFYICFTARYWTVNIIMRIFLLLFYLITLKYQGQVECHQY